MDQIYFFISKHSSFAPLLIFLLFLLAGMNIPISIDILIIIASCIAAKILPAQLFYLYLSCLCGCYFSGWVAYWVGRLAGGKILTTSLGKKLFSEKKMEKLLCFYQRYGFMTLLIGRFIPFGVRNGIFMSSGVSKASFKLFALRDLFPCLLWSSVTFFSFYKLADSYDLLIKYLKIINIIIFSTFTVAVILFICYKRVKGKKSFDNNSSKITDETD
jgi:membrane-associated protein